MKLTPSSMARFKTRRASSGSLGSPQIPLPVRRMAPKPRRFTSRSLPIVNVLLIVTMAVLNDDRFSAPGAEKSGERKHQQRYCRIFHLLRPTVVILRALDRLLRDHSATSQVRSLPNSPGSHRSHTSNVE